MKNRSKHRITIKQKITIFILISSLIVGFVGLALVYWSEYSLLRQTISRDYIAMTKLLGAAMDRIISREIKSTEVFMASSERWHKVQEYNSRYVGMSNESKEAHFKDMDQRWLEAPDNDPLITEYTQSAIGIRLGEIAQDDPSIAEIFMTDKYGGLVAASNKTSDFYQADEEWWQKSFDHGKGSVFLDNVGFDQSSKTTGIAIAVPIKNKSKEVIGVCKNYLEIKRLFSPLENFSIGKSGHVALVDKQGYLIFHRGIKPMTERFSDKVFKKMISQNSGYLLFNEIDQIHKKKMFLSYFKVAHPELLKSGIEWWICIAQDDDEVFAPLRGVIFSFVLVALIMLIIVIVIGSFLSAILVKPIIKLRDATEKIAKGDLDYKVEIKSNDEIEELAGSFNSMLDSLKNNFTTIDKLNDEIVLRKKSEEIVKKSETWFSTTLSSIGDAVITVDAAGLVTFINPVAQKLTGWSKSEAIGRYIDDVFIIRKENTDEKVDNPVLKVLSNGEIVNLANHTVLISKDGSRCAIDDSAAPIRNTGSQEIMGVVLVFRDVTQRNKVENKLRELSVAVEQSPACVVITDLKGEIQYINPKFMQITGYTFAEVVGKNPRVLKSGEQPTEFYKNLWDTIISGKEWHGEFHNKKKNGELYWEGASISPIRNNEGMITNFIAVKEDITERKRILEELKQKNIALEKLDQLKSDFVSIVSHELRTPLAITKEGISLVLDGVTGSINLKQSKILATSKNNIDRLARIINSLLDISKIESGRVELKMTNVN
jgi:PAS domain S-box-containing protein